jgi:hypothetical protein
MSLTQANGQGHCFAGHRSRQPRLFGKEKCGYHRRDVSETADFEILAIRVLKEIHSACVALVHLGVNAAGKTISSTTFVLRLAA